MANSHGCLLANRSSAALLPFPPFLSYPFVNNNRSDFFRARRGRPRCTLSRRDAPQTAGPGPLCGRRQLASTGLILLSDLICWSTDCKAAELSKALDKYVKRKKLDPLETYVPAVVLSQAQFEDIEKVLDFDKPKFADSRSLLRSGPAASLRVNIRAVAQYASEAGNGKVASDAVDQCLSALEDLDSLLLRASRSDSKASVETMKGKVNTAVAALERLLQTVPSSILNKGKAIAQDYRESISPALPEESGGENSESDVKLLEGLL